MDALQVKDLIFLELVNWSYKTITQIQEDRFTKFHWFLMLFLAHPVALTQTNVPMLTDPLSQRRSGPAGPVDGSGPGLADADPLVPPGSPVFRSVSGLTLTHSPGNGWHGHRSQKQAFHFHVSQSVVCLGWFLPPPRGV